MGRQTAARKLAGKLIQKGKLLPPRGGVMWLTTDFEIVKHRLTEVPLILTQAVDTTRYPPEKLRQIRKRKVNFLGEMQR